MKGYCEWCGRSPSLQERVRGGGIAPNEDETLYLCPECRRGAVPSTIPAQRTQRATPSIETYATVFGVTAMAVVAFALLFDSVPAKPPRTGEVQGITQLGPGRSADPTQRGSIAPSGPAPTITLGQGQEHDGPALSVGRPALRSWTDSFGRSRIQVIVEVRNDAAGWVTFPSAASTYRIMDGAREVALGAFTALAAVTGPGETAYLVDTISVAAGDLTPRLSAEQNVVAVPTNRPAVTLSISRLRLTDGIGGGVRATGLVRNDGDEATRTVIAGVIALDRDGRPLAAVFDTTDVGQLNPGDARRFTTDANPGGPPVTTGGIGELVGVAFEAGR